MSRSSVYWPVIGVSIAAIIIWKWSTVKSIAIPTDSALANGNVQAFLTLLNQYEGEGRYDLLYHTPHDDPLYDPNMPLSFNDFSTHPNIRIPFTDPRSGQPNFSTAAGGFQITYPTWRGLHVLPGAPADFGKSAQQWYAVQLLKGSGALSHIVDSDLAGALRLASGTWASLPGSTSGQRQISLAMAQSAYTNAGGTIA